MVFASEGMQAREGSCRVGNYDLRRLAQSGQSFWFTPRESGVRIPQRLQMEQYQRWMLQGVHKGVPGPHEPDYVCQTVQVSPHPPILCTVGRAVMCVVATHVMQVRFLHGAR